jgi:hypothetical protein
VLEFTTDFQLTLSPPCQTRTKITGVIQQNKNPWINSKDFYLCNSCLVGLAREKSNYLFEGLVVLCERLDELDIEAVINTAPPLKVNLAIANISL